MSMAKNKWGKAVRELARRRWWVQTAFLAGLARSAVAPHAQCLLAGVPLLLVPAGVVRLSDRRVGQFQRLARDPVCGHWNSAGLRGGVWHVRVRLGLPVRVSSGPGPSDSDAQTPAAGMDGLVSLRSSGRRWCWRFPTGLARGTRCLSAACVRRGRWKARCPTWRDWRRQANPSIGRTPPKSTILVVAPIAMLFIWRPWCTLFCPLGAIYAMFNRVSFFFLRFEQKRCQKCERLPQLVPRPRPARAAHRRHALRPLPGVYEVPRGQRRDCPHSARNDRRAGWREVRIPGGKVVQRIPRPVPVDARCGHSARRRQRDRICDRVAVTFE